jgi:methyl-accepting chemotaxis protein
MHFNESLSFTRSLEKRKLKEDVEISKILLEAMQADKDIITIGYVKDKKVSVFWGENITEPSLDERMTTLLDEYERKKWITITDSYKYDGVYVFDILYPLEDGDFVIVTFSLKELERKLNVNAIGETGKFSIVRGGGGFFLGEEVLKSRLKFLEIGNVIESEDVVIQDKRGYQVKAKKLDDIFLPFWIIFTQESSEADFLVRRLKFSLLAIVIVLLGISGTISYKLAKEFSRPISNLLFAVKKNSESEGELEYKAEKNERDTGELGLLIDEFNRMVDTLKETQQELIEKEKLAAVSEMANVIGHDRRNPLAAIKNGSYYLRYAAKSENPRVEATLGIIDREIESISKIIEDLLGYSRQRPPTLSPVNINELIDEVISIIEFSEEEK